MIQDTTFVIDLLDGDDGAIEYLSIAEDQNRPEKVSSVTVLELYEGVGQSDRPEEEKRAVLDVLDSKTAVPADQDVMRRAGRISGELVAAGTPIDREDCIIAATALQEDEPVITRNVEHFERVPDVDVESY